MKFDIVIDRTYPHPRPVVWNALTDPGALGEWLMATDFVAELNRDFVMSCRNPNGTIDHYQCRVLEIDPPNRMLWSWLHQGRSEESTVEFTLEDVPGGTRLTVRQSGDLDPDTIEAFKGGWPGKLDQLRSILRAGSDGSKNA